MESNALWQLTINQLSQWRASGADYTDELVTILQKVTTQGDTYRYIIGDVLNAYLDDLPRGERTRAINWFAGLAGMSTPKLRSYIATCKYWPPRIRFKVLERYPNITFTYLRDAVAYRRRCGYWAAICAMREAQSIQDLHRIIAQKTSGKKRPKYNLVAELDNPKHINEIAFFDTYKYKIKVYAKERRDEQQS